MSEFEENQEARSKSVQSELMKLATHEFDVGCKHLSGPKFARGNPVTMCDSGYR